jgi:transposase
VRGSAFNRYCWERVGIEQRLRELIRIGEDLREVDQALAQVTDDARLRVMLTITGINTTVAIGLLSAIGDIRRFANPKKMVSYFGLNPSVYQSGATPTVRGHITKLGAFSCLVPATAVS